MQYRRALIGVIASASLLSTVGVAHATHQPDPNYSPCRPADKDELRVGYKDVEDRDDIQHKLPTVYAKGDQGTMTGHVGICGGGGGTDPDVQYIEVGNDNPDGDYLHHSAPPAAPAEATSISPDSTLGSINVGDDYVEVDGNDNNPAVGPITQTDGYLSAGLHEDNNETASPDDDRPGVCASGDYSRAYYETQPQQKDCNDEFVTNATGQTK